MLEKSQLVSVLKTFDGSELSLNGDAKAFDIRSGTDDINNISSKLHSL